MSTQGLGSYGGYARSALTRPYTLDLWRTYNCNEPVLHYLRGKGSNVGGSRVAGNNRTISGRSLGRLRGAPTTAQI
jgi:hypothetical protein